MMISLEKKLAGKNPMDSRFYREYEAAYKNLPDDLRESIPVALPGAKRMGFEQISIDLLDKERYALYKHYKETVLHNPRYALGKFHGVRKLMAMLPRMGRMMKGMHNQFKELRQNKTTGSREIGDTNELWSRMAARMKTDWDINYIGFTEVPRELIFQGKYILYPYALVLIQEMVKKKIDRAPRFQATSEVLRVYADLGESANDLARWLRGEGIKSQPIHPLGGLVLTPPLAAKAGLGWPGQCGNLITPAYGKRQRIAVVLVEKPLFHFTDSREMSWIEEYCAGCKICVKACPTQAIYADKKPYGKEIPGLGRLATCIDYLRCFSYFEPTGGCSICLKVCPFSKGEEAFHRIRKAWEKKKGE